MDIAAQPSGRCMLLEIAPELRNQIYENIFEDQGIVTIDSKYKLPAILKTCRKISNEATKMYYASTTFQSTDDFSIHSLNVPIRLWLKHLPRKYSKLIKKVRYSSTSFVRPLEGILKINFNNGPVTRERLDMLRLRTFVEHEADLVGYSLEPLRKRQIEVPWIQVGKAGWRWTGLGRIERAEGVIR